MNQLVFSLRLFLAFTAGILAVSNGTEIDVDSINTYSMLQAATVYSKSYVPVTEEIFDHDYSHDLSGNHGGGPGSGSADAGEQINPIVAKTLNSSSLLAQRLPPANDQDLDDTFNNIADSNSWGSNESVSGRGSEVAATATVRECLAQWFQKYNIQVFVDIPCGDANWQGLITGIENIKYLGHDIADKPLERARAKNAHIPNMSFEHLDLTSTVPVRGDLILVRDVVQHLPLDKGIAMLRNAKASGAKYLAVTTFTDGVNEGTVPGGFYMNNVHTYPFDLPQPLERCQNYGQSAFSKGWFPTDFLELIDLAAWPR